MNNKKKQVQEHTSWIETLNRSIGALNRITLILIIVMYSAFVFTIGMIVSPKAQTVVVPDFAHMEYSDDISLALAIFNNYPVTWTETSKNTIGVNAYIFRRTGMEAHNMEFKLKAQLQNEFMYFFTQMNGYNAPITHTYTMQGVTEMPKTFFMHLRYTDVDGIRKEHSFREDVFTLNKRDLNRYETEYESDNIEIILNMTKNTSFNAETNQNEVVSHRIDFGINIANKNQEYHVDVQTWAVSSDQKIYPFIGYYNYTNKSTNIRMSNRILPQRLDPEYMYVRVVYYTTQSSLSEQYIVEEILYKLPIS